MKDLIEPRILNATRKLLTERVNEVLRDSEYSIPNIEFGDYMGEYAVAPVILLSACERTEKERIVRVDAYLMTIAFSLPDVPESELYCYAYSGAIGRAFYNDPTLGGVVDRAVITGKKYVQPKKPNCGEGWELQISLRVTIETVGGE